MLNSKRKAMIKAAIIKVIVAFVFAIIFVGGAFLIFKREINGIASTIKLISQETTEKILKDVKIDLESRRLTDRPKYGTKYGEIKIPSLDIDQPVYYGDTLSILKLGVGHTSGSYFPGEGGSILYMGHNNRGILTNLVNVEQDCLIYIETTYGKFTYRVYDYKVINYQDTDEVPIQKDEEILMLYTCYQSLTFGHTKKRFITYAKLESAEFF